LFSRNTNGVRSACEEATMRGVQFVIDSDGNKTAVLIDLKQHRKLWEDFYDVMLAKSRDREPRETLDSVKATNSTKKRSARGAKPQA